MRQETNPQENKSLSIKVQFHNLDKKNINTHSPKPRYKHQAFFSNHRLYIYGGTKMVITDVLDTPLELHYIEVNKNNNKWEKIKLKCNSKDLQSVSGHCGTVKDNYWYMFGGSNSDFKCNNHLWRFNLDSLEVTKLENAGEVPPPRESAFMALIEDNWLLLYGGVNTNSADIYNTFHFYNLSTKNWAKATGSYLQQLPSRHDPALCLCNGKIYLFGGTYRNVQNQQKYLNDLYEIVPKPPSQTAPCQIQLKRLQFHPMPQARSGHSLVSLSNEHLLLLGGQNSCLQIKDGIRSDGISLVQNAWLYNISVNTWHKINLSSHSFKFRTQFSCTKGSETKVYIFGGMQSYSQLLNDFSEISISTDELKKTDSPLIGCNICNSIKRTNLLSSSISASLIEDLADNIEFPFAAIGLLIDSSMHHSPTTINIAYYEHPHSPHTSKIFKIEDNAKLPWTDQQFISSMSSFSTDSIQIPGGADKKTKTAIQRQHIKRQFGTNAKIASLRLGSGFLHVSHSENGETIRVCLFTKQAQIKKQSYVLKYYVYYKQNGETVDPAMKEVKRVIQAKYGKLLSHANVKYDIKNTIFILEPKISDFKSSRRQEEELKIHQRSNDIICGLTAHYTALEEAGYNISDCVDVSLKAYLVYLYLKNEATNITLSVKNEEQSIISTQSFLQKIDKLCRHKQMLEISSLIDYDFKIVELYYLYDLKKKMNYFSNGLLIYHKNRLITRYKHPLGQLIPMHFHRYKEHYNFVRLLGYIELPDHIPVNTFKTQFIHPIMMQKLNSRLTIISEKFQAEIQNLANEGPLKRIAPTKQSQQEALQDQMQNPQFRPTPSKSRQKRKSSKLKQIILGQSKQEQPSKRHCQNNESLQKINNSYPQNRNSMEDQNRQQESVGNGKKEMEEQPEINQKKFNGQQEKILQEEEEECHIKIFVPSIKPTQRNLNRQFLSKNNQKSDQNSGEEGNIKKREKSKKSHSQEEQEERNVSSKISYPIKIVRTYPPQEQKESKSQEFAQQPSSHKPPETPRKIVSDNNEIKNAQNNEMANQNIQKE